MPATTREAFIVSRRRRQATGTYTNIAVVGNVISVQCEAHDTVSGARNMTEAKEFARRPLFCEHCNPKAKANRVAGERTEFSLETFKDLVTLAYHGFAVDVNDIEMAFEGWDRATCAKLLRAAERRGYLVSTVVNGTDRVWQTYWTHDDNTEAECLANTFNPQVANA